MRNFLIAVIVVLLVPFAAQAFTVPEEVQVTQPPAEQSVAPAVSVPTPSNDKTYKAVKSLDRRLVGEKGMVTSIRNKVGELFTAISGNKTAVNGARTAAENAETAAKSAKTAVEDLDKKLTDEKKGEFKKLRDTSWSVGAALSKDMAIYFWVTIALIVGLGVFVFFRTKGTNKLVTDVGTKVDGSPKKTVDLMKKLDEFVITFNVKDSAGVEHEVSYTPPIVMIGAEERYLTLYVPKSGAGPVPADVSDIARVAIRDQHQVVTSTKDVAKWYFDAANATPADNRGLNQRALIDALKGTPQLGIL